MPGAINKGPGAGGRKRFARKKNGEIASIRRTKNRHVSKKRTRKGDPCIDRGDDDSKERRPEVRLHVKGGRIQCTSRGGQENLDRNKTLRNPQNRRVKGGMHRWIARQKEERMLTNRRLAPGVKESRNRRLSTKKKGQRRVLPLKHRRFLFGIKGRRGVGCESFTPEIKRLAGRKLSKTRGVKGKKGLGTMRENGSLPHWQL